MNTDDREGMESVSRDENALDADRQIVWRRRDVLGILIVALIVVELSKDIISSTDRGDWLPAFHFLYYGMIACLPFLLARMAPKAAGFDIQWWPGSRWHWAWFLGMLFVLFFSKGLVAALAPHIVGVPRLKPFFGPVTPMGVVFLGISIVFITPIAEEIFFRGYLLEQLRKLTHPGIALLVQSLLFGLFHLYARGLFTSLALFALINTFLVGMILGAWRIGFRSLLPLVLAHILINATTFGHLKARYDQATGRLQPIHHTVSEETTYITEPLREDGSVDYVAALNRHFSQGVTPENNAAVLFWKAMGPEEILPGYRDKYFRMLGIPSLPEKGDYFVDLDVYIAQRQTAEPSDPKPTAGTEDNTSDQLDLAIKRPWSEEEFPVLAEWLAANEKPLGLVVEASKRPRRYDPLCCGQNAALIAVLFPANEHYRHLAPVLSARAMLRVDQGKLEEAWEDLLTCHRLARLAGQGPTWIGALVAYSAEVTACAGDQALLQHAHLTATQVAKMREDLNRLPAMPKTVDKLDVGERFTYLDMVSDCSRQGVATLAGYAEWMEPEELGDVIDWLIYYRAGRTKDWDLALRTGNLWFDRMAAAYRKPSRAEQREALSKIDDDFRRLKEIAGDAESLKKLPFANRRQALSERFSQVLLTIFLLETMIFTHPEDRWTMRFELDKLGFALASYRADHGRYPARLADLVPGHVAEVPKDIFNDADLHYRLEGNGYLLYSVGVNGKDDAAKGYDDSQNDQDWDDLAVRVPAPAMEDEKR